MREKNRVADVGQARSRVLYIVLSYLISTTYAAFHVFLPFLVKYESMPYFSPRKCSTEKIISPISQMRKLLLKR